MSVLYVAIFGAVLSIIFFGLREIAGARSGNKMRKDLEELLKRVNQLRDAIEVMHQCKAAYAESVPIIEMFGNKKVWEGVVDVFEITGHPKAKRCYAWSFPEGTETRFVTVLEIPPVESAQTAVRASIASQHRDS